MKWSKEHSLSLIIVVYFIWFIELWHVSRIFKNERGIGVMISLCLGNRNGFESSSLLFLCLYSTLGVEKFITMALAHNEHNNDDFALHPLSFSFLFFLASNAHLKLSFFDDPNSWNDLSLNPYLFIRVKTIKRTKHIRKTKNQYI